MTKSQTAAITFDRIHAENPEKTALCEPVLRAVSQEGYSIPTPIQARAIPQILAGRDVLGCAQTGTGKTAAFSLPILHLLHARKPAGAHRAIRALILSPTRELALQIDESMRTYGRHLKLRTACVFGGVGQHPQVRALRAGVDVLVATPGRLIDLMEQGYIDLSRVEIFVLDEADRMLDMGFIAPIRRIASELPGKGERQTLLFSATMPPAIRGLAESLLQNPAKVEVAAVSSTAERVEQSLFFVPKQNKPALLSHMLLDLSADRVLIFTRTKHGADKVAKHLNRSGVRADAIHGNKRQNMRQRTLNDFRTGRIRALVATDVAARGIDVDGISHVFNFDLPNEPETYVHRIGRTARAGATGEAISFCDRGGDERGFLRDIEKLIKKQIRVRTDMPELPPPSAVRSLDAEGEDRHEHRHAPQRSASRSAHSAHGESRHERRPERSERPARAERTERHSASKPGGRGTSQHSEQAPARASRSEQGPARASSRGHGHGHGGPEQRRNSGGRPGPGGPRRREQGEVRGDSRGASRGSGAASAGTTASQGHGKASSGPNKSRRLYGSQTKRRGFGGR
ncbi:MAG: DEAD/DEAH box helicase [Phycisphaeraceae bacterium]|nr:DEAD/DEAH box helicase [Phycisphaeraceae bacterium]